MRLTLLLLLLHSVCFAQTGASPAMIIPATARMIAGDELGNIYLLRDDNTLTRYTETGDSSAFYRAIRNGRIGHVDATNPLNVLVYYPAFGKVTILDRQLTQSAELDLRKLNIYTPTGIALSADGNIWVYDPFNARLLKVDDELREVTSGNDLRQQLDFVPLPSYMVERNRRLYISDTMQGILVFDQFATYLNTIPIKGIKSFQVIGSHLLYLRNDSLVAYDMERFKESIEPVPFTNKLIQALISRSILYVLDDNGLSFYKREE